MVRCKIGDCLHSIAMRALTLLAAALVAAPYAASNDARLSATAVSVCTAPPHDTLQARTAATAADSHTATAAPQLALTRPPTAANTVSHAAAASHSPVGCAVQRTATDGESAREGTRGGGVSDRRQRGVRETEATAKSSAGQARVQSGSVVAGVPCRERVWRAVEPARTAMEEAVCSGSRRREGVTGMGIWR